MGLELYSRLKLNMLSSDLVNFDEEELKKEFLRRIDPSQPVIEFSIIKLFQVRLINLIKNKVGLAKNFYIAPSEIDRMYYWEYEYMLDEVNNNIKTENERNEKENEKYGNMNPKSMMSNARNSMPHMPKSPSFSMPSIPKPSLPSFGH